MGNQKALSGFTRNFKEKSECSTTLETLMALSQQLVPKTGSHPSDGPQPLTFHYTLAGQVAGYYETYEGGFTFATVHGAGHMAPQFKPPQTYKLIFDWLSQKNEFTKA